MERAILAEAEDPEASAAAEATRGAQAFLAPGLGSDLTIVSVGQAVRSGDREVVLPLVLGDPTGQTSTLVLTLRLDALVEPEGDGGNA
jgi:hypothetical protein